jgi:hypothetical protein
MPQAGLVLTEDTAACGVPNQVTSLTGVFARGGSAVRARRVGRVDDHSSDLRQAPLRCSATLRAQLRSDLNRTSCLAVP